MKNFFIIFSLFLTLDLYGINFNWYWGVQKKNNINTFLINFLPEYHSSILDIKLELPVEIKSNFKVITTNWNSKSDIIPKLEYLNINFYKNSFIKLKPVENFSLANNAIFYKYSNNLFYPDNKYIGVLTKLVLRKFFINYMVDNIQKFNFSNLYIYYNLSPHYKIGVMWIYPVSGAVRYNLLFNYKSALNKDFNLGINNNFIFCHSKTKKIFALQTGLKVDYNSLSASIKIKTSLNTDYLYTFYDAFYLSNNNTVIYNKTIIITTARYNFFNIFSVEAGIFNSKYANTFFSIKSGNNFFSIIKIDMSVYNKNVKKFYTIFKDTDKNSIMDLKFSIPLSKNMFFTFNYIKHFKEIDGTALRVSRLYTEFKF